MTDLSSLFPQGVGNITADNDISDNTLIRGDGGAKKAQESTIVVSDDGEMNNTSQPCFLVHPTVNQENIATGGVTVIFGTERFDQGSNFASNTFTAPVDGRYLLTVALRTGDLDTAATFYYVRIITSNRYYTEIIDPNYSADLSTYTFKLSVIADMDANDTAYIQFYQLGGSAQTDISTDSSFSGAVIC